MLEGKAALNYAPYAILDYLLTPEPGKSTPLCKTVIVEQRYYDRDHARALSRFYSKSFRDVNKECIRLHFFSIRLSSSDFFNLEKQSDHYLGFCVVRPFVYRRIGRTVLKRLQSQPHLEFPTCQGDFEVNLGGSKLVIKGAVFMEQDTMVAACASAALWMSTSIMSHRYGLTECPISEITDRAAEYLLQDRPMPSEGLVSEQMLHALRTMEYDPLLLGVVNQEEAWHDIYSYIESEIPPILLCRLASGGNHTMVAVGHGYQFVKTPKLTEVAWPNEPPLEFARSSKWVPHLLVNDDQRGLYRKLIPLAPDIDPLRERIKEIYPSVNICSLDLDEWTCPVELELNMPISGIDDVEIGNIWGIIVPLPQGIPLTNSQAERKAARLLRLWHDKEDLALPDNLVLRTYAILSNEYKRIISRSDMHDFVHFLLRGKPMPRWIWVTEISTIDSYNSDDPGRWLVKGQILIDATSSAWSPDFLAFHYIHDGMGYLATMKPDHEDAEEAIQNIWIAEDEVPYHGWIR